MRTALLEDSARSGDSKRSVWRPRDGDGKDGLLLRAIVVAGRLRRLNFRGLAGCRAVRVRLTLCWRSHAIGAALVYIKTKLHGVCCGPSQNEVHVLRRQGRHRRASAEIGRAHV